MPQLREVLPRIAVEFERARRYERTVTVAVFTLDPGVASVPAGTGGNGLNGAAALGGRSLAVVLASVVRQAMREIDLVTCDPAARCCVVVMPEIGLDEWRRSMTRMRQLCAARLGCPVRADIAVFPQDGWVFLDLVDAAQRHALADKPQPLGEAASNPAL
ncbi:MAG: hypothetical protein EHM24_28870, partial [Acidobacteria bacterium]